MKKIGIFICNYNGKEYVLNCIKSLYQQTLQDFDIFVVDNASTDGTREAVKKEFGDKVFIICNSENLGGAGGFDRGLRIGLEKRYPYLMLLDNDIILDEKVLQHMNSYLDIHADVGIVGSKVMIMDTPDIIQDYGDYLDFEIFKERNGYMGQKDSKDLPLENPCDYVPSCAIMIRAELLKKSGTMPADNFIYYDDIELSHKMRLVGGKVVALGNAKVWHKGGFRKTEVNTFFRYYFLRNRLNFFAKYVSEEETERFIEIILKEVFSQLYGFYYKGMKEIYQSTMFAFDDFLHQVRGEADPSKIMAISSNDIPFSRAVKGKKRIMIKFTKDYFEDGIENKYYDLLFVITNIQKSEFQEKIWISLEECDCDRAGLEQGMWKMAEIQMLNHTIPQLVFKSIEAADLVLRVCKHVSLVEKQILPEIYVDKYCNCIVNKEDYIYFTGFETNRKFFTDLYHPLMEQAVKKIRENKDKVNDGGYRRKD